MQPVESVETGESRQLLRLRSLQTSMNTKSWSIMIHDDKTQASSQSAINILPDHDESTKTFTKSFKPANLNTCISL